MDKPPKVSIGLPVFNGERYLAKAIESLLAQSFHDFELIISDNGSTDATEAICRRYAAQDARIRYVRQAENRGAIWNFNQVFELARGEYFRWHGHDDLCAPAFLDRCVETLDSTPEMVLCLTQTARVDESGNIVGVLSSQPQGGSADDASRSDYKSRIIAGRQARSPYVRFRTVLLGPSYCKDTFGLLRTTALRKTRRILPFFGSEKIMSGELALLGTCGRIEEPLFLVMSDEEAGRRNWNSAKNQQTYIGRTDSPRVSLTRLKLLWGHVTASWHLKMPIGIRALCLLAVARYAFQMHKWKRVFREVFRGAPLTSGEQVTQQPVEEVLDESLTQGDQNNEDESRHGCPRSKLGDGYVSTCARA